jgi:hypothetical protein
MDSTWKEEVFRFQFGVIDPGAHRFPCRLSDFELDWSGGLLLHDDGASSHAITVTDVADLEFDQIASP